MPNAPLFPFGYGLSYTEFDYGDITLSTEKLSGHQTLYATITLTNAGRFDGKEVVQLYVRDMVGSMTRPVKELKGFQKVFLKAGETKEVTFELTQEDLKFYNHDLDFVFEPGEFEIMIGTNSHDVSSMKVNWEE